MSIEENLISHSSLNEKNKELKRDLEAAMELIKNYETMISELKLENTNNLKKFAHDISNPLQILSMTIESLEDRVELDMLPSLARLKRATDNMTEIIQAMRQLRVATIANPMRLIKSV